MEQHPFLLSPTTPPLSSYPNQWDPLLTTQLALFVVPATEFFPLSSLTPPWVYSFVAMLSPKHTKFLQGRGIWPFTE